MKTKFCPLWIGPGHIGRCAGNECAWFSEKYGCAINALPSIADAFQDGIVIESVTTTEEEVATVHTEEAEDDNGL